MSKDRLQLFLLDNKSKIRNGQRGFTKPRLIEWRRKSLSDKGCLIIQRAKDVKSVRARPNIERDNKVGIKRNNKVGTKEDN